MTTQRLHSILLATGLILAFAACGSKTKTLPSYYNTLNGFGVIASNPQINDTFVVVATDLRIKFNEAVDPASMAGNFKLTQYIGTQSTDVTSLLTAPQLTDSNSVMVFTPTQTLQLNAVYRFSLTSGIKSISGRSMVAMFDLMFATGAGFSNGYGSLNDPANPPFVKSLTQDIWTENFGGNAVECLGITVTFNEDLIMPPIGRVEASNLFGLIPEGGNYLSFWPMYEGRYNVWGANFGCGCDLFVATAHYNITVSEAIDLSQTQMTSEHHSDFGIPYGASCGY